MTQYGRQVLTPTIGQPLTLLFNHNGVLWVPGGMTIDWSTQAAVATTAVTLPEGITVPIGKKALRFGQVMCKITASGKYGPYDVAAVDGRGTLRRGECFILNETILEEALVPGLPAPATDYVGGIYAGVVWFARLLLSTVTNPLIPAGPVGPTKAIFEAGFPEIQYAVL